LQAFALPGRATVPLPDVAASKDAVFDSFRSVGPVLAGCVAASFLGLGAGALFAPRALAENYGLPVDEPKGIGYVRALGARDAILGLLTVAFLVQRDHRALATTVGLSALVGASDFAVIASTRGTEAPLSLAIHGTGTVGLLGIWALLRA